MNLTSNGGVKKLEKSSEKFPKLLKEIPNPPEAIYYLGEIPSPEDFMISIVGTRKATPEGKIVAKQIARDLARRGIIVVSGLAFGIDAAAHEGALLGGGRTIAVLADGLEAIYPREHYPLSQKILAKNGAVLSEYAKSRPYYDGLFLERNRIISGLSVATVVVEAPMRSGSLATARHALDQGREVFVVPGPPFHPNYRGSHELIRGGARLATSAEEILEDLSASISNFCARGASASRGKFLISKPDGGIPKVPNDKIKDEVQLAIFKTIQEAGEPLYLDKIIELTKLEPQVLNEQISYLELEGLIEQKNGKFRINK